MAVGVELVGNGGEDLVGGRAAAADDDELGVAPGLVEGNAEAPGWVAIVFDDVHAMPAVLGNIRKNLALAEIGADAFCVGHRRALPYFLRCGDHAAREKLGSSDVLRGIGEIWTSGGLKDRSRPTAVAGTLEFTGLKPTFEAKFQP